MDFKLLPQSDVWQPNSIKGLLVWLDASESGTLSRSNSTAKLIYDKSPGGRQFVAVNKRNQPKILQSKLNGHTVLRFEPPYNFYMGDVQIVTCDIVVIAVCTGKGGVTVDSFSCEIVDNCLRIPKRNYNKSIDLAELIIYEKNDITQYHIDKVVSYLTKKWAL